MTTQTPPNAVAYSVRDVARLTGIGEYTIRNEINKRNLRARRVGVSDKDPRGRLVIRDADLRAWLDALPEVD